MRDVCLFVVVLAVVAMIFYSNDREMEDQIEKVILIVGSLGFLLWFLGAMILTIAAVVFTTALTFTITEQRPPAFGGMIRVQIQGARQAYESGGPAALARGSCERLAHDPLQGSRVGGKGQTQVGSLRRRAGGARGSGPALRPCRLP